MIAFLSYRLVTNNRKVRLEWFEPDFASFYKSESSRAEIEGGIVNIESFSFVNVFAEGVDVLAVVEFTVVHILFELERSLTVAPHHNKHFMP